MISIYPINDAKWQELRSHVATSFQDLTLKRGFQYYKQERIREFSMPEPERIEASVQGTELYQVNIELNSLTSSRCSCPVGECCKHMAAALMQYAHLQQRSVPALVNAHSALALERTPPPSHQAALSRSSAQQGELKAAAAMRWRDQASGLARMPVTKWHELFEACTAPIGTAGAGSRYAESALDFIFALNPRLAPGLEQLYELHAHLFVLDKLIKPVQQGLHTNLHLGYYTQVAADDLTHAVSQLLQQKLELEAEEAPEEAQRLQETLDYLRDKMLTEPQSSSYFLSFYEQLWQTWNRPGLKGTEAYREELSRLETAEDSIGPALSRLSWLLAQSSMHFYLHQDEEAWDKLREANNSFHIHPGRLFYYLRELQHLQAWDRLQRWLIEIGPLLTSARASMLNDYLSYWEEVTKQLPEAESHMWESLIRMLPSASSIYQEALLKHGKWQRWMDYQLSTGREPLEFRVTELAPVEKNAPELLLPFYHQAVQRYILHKNRDSYKDAVKLLKRLAKLYKKLKQEARWEEFLEGLIGRYSRLRAFQEELQRGKLL
ncbi:hypothetical protein DCC85_01430 [Paenibacillus sp. CAA11]|uniref:SWIM zinc finger family protein n=1 Tax=Paenibacillus sp. CAA11 TaxID=1532905 RepID=UPI000D3A6E73|nr:SWIM zinc finger family protein [Paenibacillus sp. CAA11]AWB43024.1 hypothetical protein DCC85_01430 [Paenibacillus sp. CAA11]